MNLRERVYGGSYGKPFILENRRRRFLHFDFGAIQSAMDLDAPDSLTLAYTRKMMAFLLFNRTPERSLLLGLGGGSLAKFCYAHLPSTAITAVEMNTDVIALRDEFFIPADDHRFRVINADGAAYTSSSAHRKDVILADAYDRAGISAELDSAEFYRSARRCLTTSGVFVANVFGDDGSNSNQLAKLREAFDDELLTLPVEDDGNVIAFGFKSCRPTMPSNQIELRARDLKRHFGLDFPKYVRRFARDASLRQAHAGMPSIARTEINLLSRKREPENHQS